MIRLKEMNWSDDWETYIVFGDTNVDKQYKWDNFFNTFTPYMFQILSVMHQLENKMTVYDAFLKGLEIYYCSTTCGQESFLQEYRRIQKKLYKNMKNGIIDEFLVDVHSVMIQAGIKWCSKR